MRPSATARNPRGLWRLCQLLAVVDAAWHTATDDGQRQAALKVRERLVAELFGTAGTPRK